jgi:hypothetical protein
VATRAGARGFGTRMIERGLARDLGGKATLDFTPEGVVYTLRAPLSQTHEFGRMKPAKVMIVEDEALVAMMVEDMLGDLGCEVAGSFGAVATPWPGWAARAPAPDGAVLDVNIGGEMVFPVAEAAARAGRAVRVRHRLWRPAPQGLREHRGAGQADQCRPAGPGGRPVRPPGLRDQA